MDGGQEVKKENIINMKYKATLFYSTLFYEGKEVLPVERCILDYYNDNEVVLRVMFWNNHEDRKLYLEEGKDFPLPEELHMELLKELMDSKDYKNITGVTTRRLEWQMLEKLKKDGEVIEAKDIKELKEKAIKKYDLQGGRKVKEKS